MKHPVFLIDIFIKEPIVVMVHLFLIEFYHFRAGAVTYDMVSCNGKAILKYILDILVSLLRLLDCLCHEKHQIS